MATEKKFGYKLGDYPPKRGDLVFSTNENGHPQSLIVTGVDKEKLEVLVVPYNPHHTIRISASSCIHIDDLFGTEK